MAWGPAFELAGPSQKGQDSLTWFMQADRHTDRQTDYIKSYFSIYWIITLSVNRTKFKSLTKCPCLSQIECNESEGFDFIQQATVASWGRRKHGNVNEVGGYNTWGSLHMQTREVTALYDVKKNIKGHPWEIQTHLLWRCRLSSWRDGNFVYLPTFGLVPWGGERKWYYEYTLIFFQKLTFCDKKSVTKGYFLCLLLFAWLIFLFVADFTFFLTDF